MNVKNVAKSKCLWNQIPDQSFCYVRKMIGKMTSSIQAVYLTDFTGIKHKFIKRSSDMLNDNNNYGQWLQLSW